MAFSKNIVSDYSAVNDALYVITDVTVSAGSTNLTIATSAFASPRDVGKTIILPNDGFHVLQSTSIASVTSGTNIRLSNAATYGVSAQNSIVGWGTDNKTAFNNFRTAAGVAGSSGTLTVPSGNYLISYANFEASSSERMLFQGIADLTVDATSATFVCGTVKWGMGPGENADGSALGSDFRARVTSAPAGQSFVDLLVPADASKFAVNRWVKLHGLVLQQGGYPSSHQFLEYLQITDITGSRITFSSALQNSYLSTWPLYDGGGFVDYAGNATITLMSSDWGGKATYNIQRIVQEGEIDSNGKDITFNNTDFPQGTFLGTVTGSGPFVSQNKTIVYNGCTMHSATNNSTMEADKEVESCTLTNCAVDVLNFQSSSVDQFILDNTDVASIIGGPRRMTVRNGSTCPSFRMGASNYGASESLTISDSTITWGQANLGALIGPIPGTWSMSGGTITIPNSENGTFLGSGAGALPASWAYPGATCCWEDRLADFLNKPFRVSSVTKDATNTYVVTTWSGGFPSTLDGNVWIRVHPCPNASGSGNSGNSDSIDLNLLSGAPIFSKLQRSYTGNDLGVSNQIFLWGLITRLSVNVTVASTRTGSETLTFTSPCKVNNILNNYTATFNLKVAGERVITPSGVTGTQSGDSGLTYFNTSVDNVWGPQYCYVQVTPGTGGGTVSQFTITVETDGSVSALTESVLSPMLALRLRLFN